MSVLLKRRFNSVRWIRKLIEKTSSHFSTILARPSKINTILNSVEKQLNLLAILKNPCLLHIFQVSAWLGQWHTQNHLAFLSSQSIGPDPCKSRTLHICIGHYLPDQQVRFAGVNKLPLSAAKCSDCRKFRRLPAVCFVIKTVFPCKLNDIVFR